MNDPHEIANTFNDYFLTVVDIVKGNIKKSKNDPRENMNPSSYLINNFNSTFPRIIVTMPQLMKLVRLSNPYRLKTHMGMMKSP